MELRKLVGTYKVRDSRIIIDNGHGHEIPLITWLASIGCRVGDILKITVEKVKEDEEERK